MKNRILWVTEGDLAGISYEILEKSVPRLVEISEHRPVVLVGTGYLNPPGSFKIVDNLSAINDSGLFYLNSLHKSKEKGLIEAGKPSRLTGELSYISLKNACKFIREYSGDLITLPLSKEWVIKSGKKKFTGHTEFLSEFFSCDTYMIMYSDVWKVLVLTTHIPLKKVVPTLRKFNWKNMFSALKNSDFFFDADIGLCGINPHAGEGGKIGKEEEEILLPVVHKFKQRNYKISGPHPADTIFTEEWKGKFDLILSCYHDQGLAPFKALAGKKGLNLTIGLPFTRVSPDHGPAYGIAGKNLASPESLETCINFFLKSPKPNRK